MADESKTRSIAIAGIVATAVVGAIGAVSSFLIAREEQGTQRSLAHSARVYDRRADTYIDALKLINREDLQLAAELNRLFHHGPNPSDAPWGPQQLGVLDRRGDQDLYARLVAFGSPEVVKRYRALRQIIYKLPDGIEKAQEANFPRDTANLPAYSAAAYRVTIKIQNLVLEAAKRFSDETDEFRAAVHRDLG